LCGSLVVARATGGLRDTVFPIRQSGDDLKGNGFLFSDFSAWAFYDAMERAHKFFKENNDAMIQKARDNARSSVYFGINRPATIFAACMISRRCTDYRITDYLRVLYGPQSAAARFVCAPVAARSGKGSGSCRRCIMSAAGCRVRDCCGAVSVLPEARTQPDLLHLIKKAVSAACCVDRFRGMVYKKSRQKQSLSAKSVHKEHKGVFFCHY
jgi:hypothetical protein